MEEVVEVDRDEVCKAMQENYTENIDAKLSKLTF
jgi:hypothetical protein